MKILHSESSLGWGGQERRILLEMEAMRKRGWDVHVVCRPGSRISEKASGRGFRVHVVEMKRWFHPSTQTALRSLLHREHFDVVHTHSSGDSWALGVAAKLLGRARPRVVRTRHLSTPVRGAFVYTRLTDGIITTGKSIRSHLIEKGVRPEKIVSIPTGVDLEIFRISAQDREAFRREIGADEQTAVIGNVAVLRSWKGHDDFIDVAKRVHAARPNTLFVIAGDGPQSDRLKERVRAEGLSGFIRLLGHRDDVARILSGLDIFLFTSYANEGVPQAVAQAMSMAKPVVATRVGSVEDLVVDGESGLLVPPRDVEGLASKVESLLQDSALAQRLGDAARTRVISAFSLGQMEENLCKVYDRVFGRDGNGAASPRLRIALVRQKVSPHGGAESVVHRLAGELASRGHDVHVLAADWENPQPHVTYHRMPVRRGVSWLGAFSFQRSVKEFLSSQRFDIVHGFDKTYPVDVYRAGDGSHRAWLDHAGREMTPMRRALLRMDPKNWALLRLEKNLLADPALKTVIANSGMVRRELLQYHDLAPEKTAVIRNGIDISSCRAPASPAERRQRKSALGLNPNNTVLLFVGSNFTRKGLRYALEAVAHHKQNPITLLVAGKGREQKYRQYCQAQGITEKVRFLGTVRDTAPLYQASDLLILPTLYDPFSNVCLEAMAHRMPVITTPTNGASEVILEAKTGWIAPPNQTPAALGLALQSNLWEMGTAALESCKSHTFSRMTDEILEIYTSISSK